MADLKTTYLGLTLRNPIIVGSSVLTKSVEGVKECAAAGAGAVVLKSLFEEQIRAEFEGTNDSSAQYAHPDAMAYLQADMAVQFGPQQYLSLIKEASAAVSIPVIASVNCVSPEHWVSFATQIEAAGAAALEMNLYLSGDASKRSEDLEDQYVAAVKSVKQRLKIPVAVKLSPYFTNMSRMAVKLQDAGADGLVLFNRLFSPDIDLDKVAVKGGLSLSGPGEYLPSLRWVGKLHGRLKADLCAATGIHDAQTAMKMILAGANAVQVTSILFKNQVSYIEEMLEWMNAWMDEKGEKQISDIQGKLSWYRVDNRDLFERGQYIKTFVGAE
jgi:dihydroorotate dehydrogenase (fumarate)